MKIDTFHMGCSVAPVSTPLTAFIHKKLALPEGIAHRAEGIALIYKGSLNEKKKDVDLHVNMCNK